MPKLTGGPIAFFRQTFFAIVFALTALVAPTASAQDGLKEIKIAPDLATSTNFIDVLVPFLSGHPETSEGLGIMSLNVEKVDDVFEVEIIKRGYLDDSVSGEIFQGTVIWTDRGEWELIEMASKPICARGEAKDGRCS